MSTSGGSVLWTVRLGSPVFSTPAAAADRVFVATAGGSVFSLDSATGVVVWKAETESGGVFSSVVLETGKVLFGGQVWCVCVYL